MATFVHITAAKYAAAIRRSGLSGKDNLFGGGRSYFRNSVFAFPVLESHTLTHQWTREIGKWRRQPLIGVYFRIRDDEPVCVRRYGNNGKQMTAAAAVAAIRAHEAMDGFEVIVERKIGANEIQRIAPLRNIVGWRHAPNARGRKPCPCEICLRGQPNSRKIMERAAREERKLDQERARRIAIVEAQVAARNKGAK